MTLPCSHAVPLYDASSTTHAACTVPGPSYRQGGTWLSRARCAAACCAYLAASSCHVAAWLSLQRAVRGLSLRRHGAARHLPPPVRTLTLGFPACIASRRSRVARSLRRRCCRAAWPDARRASWRRHSYCNRSNVTRKLKTPGGKLVLQYTAKKAKGPQTPVGDQGRIHGVRCAATPPCARR